MSNALGGRSIRWLRESVAQLLRDVVQSSGYMLSAILGGAHADLAIRTGKMPVPPSWMFLVSMVAQASSLCLRPFLRPNTYVVCLLVLMSGLAGQPALGASGSLDVDGASVRWAMYAPEWIWQRQNINIVFVLENTSAAPTTVTAQLDFPQFNPRAFGFEGPRSQSVVLAPGERGRIVFANILARDEFALAVDVRTKEEDVQIVKTRTEDGQVRLAKVRMVKVDTGHHAFSIRLQAQSGDASREARVHYPVMTVRGAAVSEGPLATWLPVLLIFGWCVVLFWVVPRMAERGAWLRP